MNCQARIRCGFKRAVLESVNHKNESEQNQDGSVELGSGTGDVFDCLEVVNEHVHGMEHQVQAATAYEQAKGCNIEVAFFGLLFRGFGVRRLRRIFGRRNNRRIARRLFWFREGTQVAVVRNSIVEQILDVGMLTQPCKTPLAHVATLRLVPELSRPAERVWLE
jgi:hypothetical protein